MTAMTEATALRVEAKLDRLMALLERREAQGSAMDELVEVAMPMAKVALDGAVETFAELERAGWFAMGRELARVADRVVRSYTPEDVRRLGDQVVGLLDTVRNVTQPDMMALVNEVAGAVHEADEADPKGMWGLMRAGRDPDVRKGLGVMVGLLRQVGRAAERIGAMQLEAPPVRGVGGPGGGGGDGDGKASWMRHLAPRRKVTPPVTDAPTSAGHEAPAEGTRCGVAPAHPTSGGGKPILPAGVALPRGWGLDGFMTDPSAWTPKGADALAGLLSLTLDTRHHEILAWAREEYARAGASPNIRRVAQGSGVAIRELYALFPGKPGVLIAMLAGIPKPGGCL